VTHLNFLATCPKGLNALLAEEIAQLGALQVSETVTGVRFSAPLAGAYRTCLWSRFANRVLLELAVVAADRADDVYAAAKAIPWHEHLSAKETLAVDFSGQSETIRNTHFGALKVKDGIVDALRERGLGRPSVDARAPDVRIHVRLHRGKTTFSLDLSGDSLHRRGYRLDSGKAPLRENLAAAVVARAGWPAVLASGGSFLDPMCGSGTLLIEAALMALDRAPGLERSRWGFSRWGGHMPAQWQAILAEAQSRALHDLPQGIEIRGYDGDAGAVRRATENASRMGLERVVRVRHKALADLTRPSHQPMPFGLLVTNPPWGERIGEKTSLPYLYRQLGSRWDQEFRGWTAALLTSDLTLGRAVGLRSHKQYKLHNGPLELNLLLFDLSADNVWRDASAKPVVLTSVSTAQPAEAESASALSEGATMVANRLRKNLRRLKPWLKRDRVTCFRLYDADMPEYAAAVDLYDGRAHVAEYAPPKGVDPDAATRRLQELMQAVEAVCPPPAGERIALKRRQRQRGLAQYEKTDDIGERIEVVEGRARLLVNLHDYLDTGLFLDHRPLRLRIAEEAAGKRFLNLFCYTGTATIHAALGGASASTSVDLSNTYLRWMRANLALNGLSDRQHRVERADVMAWLRQSEQLFDLILLDPPSFSNSSSTESDFDVQRDHPQLLELVMARLAPGGVLYFSNNRRRFVLDEQVEARWQCEQISAATLPPDFARRPDIHHCWRLTHLS
jgi:23S rRNA (guanine2445-N2)-methyltransferase / 23S rRNA (guanine2069-N7)-methyltransferase